MVKSPKLRELPNYSDLKKIKQPFFTLHHVTESILNPASISNLDDVLVALLAYQKNLFQYHQCILKVRSEKEQMKFLPNTEDTARYWKIFTNFDQKLQKLGCDIGIELAPFMVCGRNEKHKNLLERDLDPYKKVPVKNVVEFVEYASQRQKRVIAFYLVARIDHANGIMFKPEGMAGNFVGLHKFDPNGCQKSSLDSKIRQEKFPDHTYHSNHCGPQTPGDHTCTFWSLQWILWKYITLIRAVHSPCLCQNNTNRMIDSFRDNAFKYWIEEMRYLVRHQHRAKPKMTDVLPLSNPESFPLNVNVWEVTEYYVDDASEEEDIEMDS